MSTEGDQTLNGEHTVQYTDDGQYNCTPETYTILLINVTLINLIFKNGWGKIPPKFLIKETKLWQTTTDLCTDYC